MKKLIKKDKRNRNLVFENELKRFLLKNIIKNNYFVKNLQLKANFKLFNFSRASSLTYYINRCIITGRKKRINNLYSFSRIIFLKFVRFGYFNGMKKSSW